MLLSVGLSAANWNRRYEEKGGVVDLEKARWYLDRLVDEETSG